MTWFLNPCLQEPERRDEKFARITGSGVVGQAIRMGLGNVSVGTFCWQHSGGQHSDGQHFGFAKCAGKSEARNNCIYWASLGPIYCNWQPFKVPKKKPNGKCYVGHLYVLKV